VLCGNWKSAIRSLPAQGLPDRINLESFDDPATLAGFIDAMRWGAVTSADPNRYQAPFWSARQR
jgi:hypothetical protein